MRRRAPSFRTLPGAAMTVAVVVVPVSVLLALAVGVMLVAVAWRRVVRPAVGGAGMVVAAAQNKAGGGQHDENLGGIRDSKAHHILPWRAQCLCLGLCPAERDGPG